MRLLAPVLLPFPPWPGVHLVRRRGLSRFEEGNPRPPVRLPAAYLVCPRKNSGHLPRGNVQGRASAEGVCALSPREHRVWCMGEHADRKKHTRADLGTRTGLIIQVISNKQNRKMTLHGRYTRRKCSVRFYSVRLVLPLRRFFSLRLRVVAPQHCHRCGVWNCWWFGFGVRETIFRS